MTLTLAILGYFAFFVLILAPFIAGKRADERDKALWLAILKQRDPLNHATGNDVDAFEHAGGGSRHAQQ